MRPEDVDRAAQILRDARLGNYLIDNLPEASTPQSVDDGYAIQERLLELLDIEGAGWLLGLTNPYMQKVFNVTEPYYGRLLKPNLYWSPQRFPADAFLTRGIECEVAFRMAHDVPPRERPYELEEVAAAVGSMHPSVEIVNAHFNDWLNLSMPHVLADNGTDGALICGEGRDDWRGIDRINLPVVLQINGELVTEGRGENALGDPLKALTWLANALNARGKGLTAGEMINTGTCTALTQGEPGDEILASFGDLGEVRVTLER